MWRYGLVFLFPFLYTAVLSAQNILQEDSVWGSVGKDTIRLNPEYLKAIENGTLINIGQPLELESSRLPILIDFSEYIKADTIRQLLQVDSLPRQCSGSIRQIQCIRAYGEIIISLSNR